MATVFFGENTFDDYIKDQIKVRQKATGRELGENVLLGYFSKTCWVSLASFVNIESEKLRNNLNVTQPSELSTNIILRNGVTSLKNNKTSTIAGGIGPDKTYGNKFLSTNPVTKQKYPFGLKPIPGITSVNIKSKGTYGSLLEADINFACHDIVQLEKLEPLFMRPGYSVMLEWGWSQCLDKDGNIKNTGQFLNTSNPSSTQNSIQKFISERRKLTEGNRDGMIGLVKNFTWSLRKDGGYDCKLSLISTGAVAEGIPIDTNVFGFTTAKSLKYLGDFTKNQIAGTGGIPFLDTDKELLLGLREIKGDNPVSSLYTSLLYLSLLGETKANFQKFLSEESYKVFEKDLEPILKNFFYSSMFRITLPPPKDSEGQGDGKKVTYLQFNVFIQFINEYFTLQNGKTKEEDKYIIKFFLPDRIKADLNQFSTDLTTCLIVNKAFKEFNGIEQIKTVAPSYSLKFPVLQENALGEFNFINNIGASDTQEEIDAKYHGVLGNVFISIDCIYNAYSNNKNSLLNFIKAILDDINKSIGGINDFLTLIDPDNPSIARIIDTNYIEPSDNIEVSKIFGLKEGEFEIFNNKCVLTNIQISSEIPNSMQTSIAIGASDNTNNTSSNTNPYKAFNLGIKDRLMKDKFMGKPLDFNEEINNNKRLLETLSLCFLWGDDYFSVAQSNSELESSLKNYINWVRSNTIFPTESSQAMIPLKLSFEMEGIAGILIGQRFGIPSRILPSSYRSSDGTPKVGFIVTEMSHKIDNNRWSTKVGAMMYALEKQILLDIQKDPESAAIFGAKLLALENSANTAKAQEGASTVLNAAGEATLNYFKTFTGGEKTYGNIEAAKKLFDEVKNINEDRLFAAYKLWYMANPDSEIVKEGLIDKKAEVLKGDLGTFLSDNGINPTTVAALGVTSSSSKFLKIAYIKSLEEKGEDLEVINRYKEQEGITDEQIKNLEKNSSQASTSLSTSQEMINFYNSAGGNAVNYNIFFAS